MWFTKHIISTPEPEIMVHGIIFVKCYQNFLNNVLPLLCSICVDLTSECLPSGWRRHSE